MHPHQFEARPQTDEGAQWETASGFRGPSRRLKPSLSAERRLPRRYSNYGDITQIGMASKHFI